MLSNPFRIINNLKKQEKVRYNLQNQNSVLKTCIMRKWHKISLLNLGLIILLIVPGVSHSAPSLRMVQDSTKRYTLPKNHSEIIIDCTPTFRYINETKTNKCSKLSWTLDTKALGYNVYYIKNGKEIFLKNILPGYNFFHDQDCGDSKDRKYVVKAIYYTGPKTANNLDTKKSNYLLPPLKFKTQVDIEKGEAKLTWSSTEAALHYKLEILKSSRPIPQCSIKLNKKTSTNKPHVLYTLKDTTYFFKFTPNIKDVFYWRIKSVDKSGESAFSKLIPFSEEDYLNEKSVPISLNDNTMLNQTSNKNKFYAHYENYNNLNKSFLSTNFNQNDSTAINTIYELKKKYEKIKSRIWSISIGINEYNELPNLRYSTKNAISFYNIMKDKYSDDSKNKSTTKLLTDKNATKVKILKQLNKIAKRSSKNDVIIIYFSGHGDKGAIVPTDSDGINKNLDLASIREVINRTTLSKNILLLIDACYSGSKSTTEQITPNNYSLFSSSGNNEISFEDSTLKSGIFSYYLIKGLEGNADIDKNCSISLDEIYDYVHSNVVSYTLDSQKPVINKFSNISLPMKDCTKLSTIHKINY